VSLTLCLIATGAHVEVAGAGQLYNVTATVKDGLWKACLKPHSTGGSYNLTAKSSEGAVSSIHDVTFGEVPRKHWSHAHIANDSYAFVSVPLGLVVLWPK
jgi:hypothetical protein